MARLIPSFDNLQKVHTISNSTHDQIISFLESNLDSNWEIYVEPYFNGLRPDLVLVHESHGVQLINFSQLNLKHCHYFGGGKRYIVEDIRFIEKDQNDGLIELDLTEETLYRLENAIPDPVWQMKQLIKRIYRAYLPEIDWLGQIDKRAYSVILGTVCFTHSSRFDILKFYGESHESGHTKGMGFGEFRKSNLTKILKFLRFQQNDFALKLGSEFFRRLRWWLNPQVQVNEIGLYEVSHRQNTKYTKPESGHYLITGGPGSGKTQIIVNRAAILANQGLKVLVVCFNITLIEYIRASLEGCPIDFDWRNIRINHFYGFLNEECIRFGLDWEIEGTLEKVTQSIIKTMDNIENFRTDSNSPEYDAILIDEGQDILFGWYQYLIRYVGKRNEVLVLADFDQNIYGRDITWLKNFRAVTDLQLFGQLRREPIRFSGIDAILANFSKQFLESQEMIGLPSSNKGSLVKGSVTWKNLESLGQIKETTIDAIDTLRSQGVQISDIVLLTLSHRVGLSIVSSLNKKGLTVLHTFSEDHQARALKVGFRKKDDRVRATTVHSFKGWEWHSVILILTDLDTPIEVTNALIFTGISRAVGNLHVINLIDRFKEFGKGLA